MLHSGWPRLAVLAPAVYGAALLTFRLAAHVAVVPLLAGLVAVAAAALAAAAILPQRRPRPYWGRAAEIGESLLGAALIPLLLAVLDAYGAARSLGG
jgi:hypothetical protein